MPEIAQSDEANPVIMKDSGFVKVIDSVGAACK